MSKMVSPLLMSVINQGPPALFTGESSTPAAHSFNLKLNMELIIERQPFSRRSTDAKQSCA